LGSDIDFEKFLSRACEHWRPKWPVEIRPLMRCTRANTNSTTTVSRSGFTRFSMVSSAVPYLNWTPAARSKSTSSAILIADDAGTSTIGLRKQPALLRSLPQRQPPAPPACWTRRTAASRCRRVPPWRADSLCSVIWPAISPPEPGIGVQNFAGRTTLRSFERVKSVC